MRASKTNESLNQNVSDVTEHVFSDAHAHYVNMTRNLNDASTRDSTVLPFVLSTEMCIYIHSGLLASVFIIGLLR